MKIHYYSEWFYNALPEKLIALLQADITDRKSLVMICTTPSDYKAADEAFNTIKQKWFDSANIIFSKYHLIGYRVSKEKAHKLLRDASVIFFLGGDSRWQNNFLAEYELSDPIKNSNAIIIGNSSGATNMSAKWICSKYKERHVNRYKIEKSTIYDGVGLDDFTYEPYFEFNNTPLLEEELFPLSQEIAIYATNEEGFIRIKDGKFDFVGNVFLISGSMVQQMNETL